MESNQAFASGEETQLARLPEAARDAPVTRETAESNLVFLRTQVESWLAVLFNVFSSIDTDGRGAVADVITAWISIADAKVCTTHGYGSSNFLTDRIGDCQSLPEVDVAPQAKSAKASSAQR